jgi:hypothetical protein
VTPEQIRATRAEAQGLGSTRPNSVLDAVRRAVGLQAQDVRACRLSVRARTDNLTRSDVDAAVADGSVVRTWAMRGTLHMVAAEDRPWLVGLLGPHFAKRFAPRRRQLGLDDAITGAAVDAIREVLDEPLTRAQLMERLAAKGVRLDLRTQAPAHLLSYAAMSGVIHRGPDVNDDEPTYVLSPEHTPVPEEEPMARLAERYLDGYGPAQAEDFAAWSGLPLTKARAAMGAASVEPVEPSGIVRMVGHFDTYLLGYKSRELAVPKEFDRRIQAGGGFIMPAVLVDGRAVATWRQTRKRNRLMIDVEPFGTTEQPRIRDEVADLGRFLGVEADISNG